MPRQQITHAAIFRVLIAGFMLVILLLIVAAFIGVQSVRSIKESVADLVAEELLATRLIDDIQHEQVALSAVFLKLSRDPEAVDREKVLSELDDADARMDDIDDMVKGTPEEALWNELKKASLAFSEEARRLLSLDNPTTLLSRDLFRRHQEALAIVAKVAAASNANASAARQKIETRSRELLKHSALLLGACLLLALICAVLTVRMTVDLFRRMERQTGELSRVSWHLLENQETTARRFSHELHDELGQSLTAVKANLHGLASAGAVDRARLEDCVALVNESIGNVRELSQLLHPTILDDFGLSAAIGWLAERFTQRTGIEVDYRSEFKDRIGEDTETHLFRICQEALTNSARHSGATTVAIRLEQRGDKLRLTISDNGRGLPDGVAEQRGMGLIGMRARARGAGGTLAIDSVKGKGLTVMAEVPASGARHRQKDKNLVGR
jgi:signal transduction histidine kinase